MKNTYHIFKTALFSKKAKKEKISDKELVESIKQILKGQGVDLGGGVFKKRIGENRYRSIILAKTGDFWVYEYLFAKKDQDNITDKQLKDFKKLATAYQSLTPTHIEQLMEQNHFLEIFYD
jgi:hypothetical protein